MIKSVWLAKATNHIDNLGFLNLPFNGSDGQGQPPDGKQNEKLHFQFLLMRTP